MPQKRQGFGFCNGKAPLRIIDTVPIATGDRSFDLGKYLDFLEKKMVPKDNSHGVILELKNQKRNGANFSNSRPDDVFDELVDFF